MKIRCPACGHRYDGNGYPPGYQFQCVCGVTLEVPAMSQPESYHTVFDGLVIASPTNGHGVRPALSASSAAMQAAAEVSFDSMLAPEERTAITPSQQALQVFDEGEDVDPLDATISEDTVRIQNPLLQSALESGVAPQAFQQSGHAVTPYASQGQLPHAQTSHLSSPSGPTLPSMPPMVGPGPMSSDFAQHASVEDVEVDILRTEPRVIAALFLSLLCAFGPLVVVLAVAGIARIRQHREVLRGQGLAFLLLLGGLVQSIGLVGGAWLFFSQPQHPWIRPVVALFSSELPLPRVFSQAKGDAQPAQLSLAKAQALLRESWGGDAEKKRIGRSAVVQFEGARHAYLHWYDLQSRSLRRSLYHYSNRGYWFLVSETLPERYEVRCALVGSTKLSAVQARRLIQDFWKLRGRFSRVQIVSLYVHQRTEQSRVAHAYWTLEKRRPGLPTKTWQVRSLFHRASSGAWHLSRYASRTQDEVAKPERTRGASLDAKTAEQLLRAHAKATKRPFEPTLFHLFLQAAKGLASAHWLEGPKKTPAQALFRLSNAGVWVLAKARVSRPSELIAALKTKTRPDEARTRQRLRRYWRQRHRQRLIVDTMYLFSNRRTSRTWVRWLKHPRKRSKPYEALLQRSTRGQWFLFHPARATSLSLRFALPGKQVLSVATASQLIRQFWKESEEYAGARMGAMYLYYPKPNDRRVVDAHWELHQGERVYRMCSRFFRSDAGRWFLGLYELRQTAFHVTHRAKGPSLLSNGIAQQLLRDFFGKQTEKKQKIAVLYSYQERKENRAFVRWYQQSGDAFVANMALFHRDQEGQWYLSLQQWNLPPRPMSRD